VRYGGFKISLRLDLTGPVDPICSPDETAMQPRWDCDTAPSITVSSGLPSGLSSGLYRGCDIAQPRPPLQCIYRAQRYTTRSATLRPALHIVQHCTARSATQRAALDCAQRHTMPSVAHCPALHSAQQCTTPSATQGRTQHRQ